MDYHTAIISSLPRTLETFSYLKLDIEYQRTPLIDEVQLEPFEDSARSYGLGWLYFMARLQWGLNHSRQPETRRQTIERANRFIEEFLREDKNYLVIGHGIFLSVLSRVLLKRGFKGRSVFHFRNGEHSTYYKLIS